RSRGRGHAFARFAFAFDQETDVVGFWRPGLEADPLGVERGDFDLLGDRTRANVSNGPDRGDFQFRFQFGRIRAVDDDVGLSFARRFAGRREGDPQLPDVAVDL